MPIAWKEYRGKKYLHVDFRGLKDEPDMIGLLEQFGQTLKATTGKVLVLCDFTGTSVGTAFVNRAKTLAKEVIAARLSKSAILGITGVKSIILQGILTFSGDKATRAMPTETEALNWLAA